MINISKVIQITDSNNLPSGYYKVVFADNSFIEASIEMNADVFEQATEWIKSNSLDYDIKNLCTRAKQQIKNKIDDLYSKSLILHIQNGFAFAVDLRSKDGDNLMAIVNNSLGSYTDVVKGKKAVEFFITIQEGSAQKQISCRCLNWIWQYIFEELLVYVKTTKQLKENLIATIDSCNTIEELQEVQLNFYKPDGITLDISATIQTLLMTVSDLDSNGNVIKIPQYAIDAIRNVNRELFRYVSQSQAEDNIKSSINKSWFT
jgi:hypothetical protein